MVFLGILLTVVMGNLISTGIIIWYAINRLTNQTKAQVQMQIDALREVESKKAQLVRDVIAAQAKKQQEEYGFYPATGTNVKKRSDS